MKNLSPILLIGIFSALLMSCKDMQEQSSKISGFDFVKYFSFETRSPHNSRTRSGFIGELRSNKADKVPLGFQDCGVSAHSLHGYTAGSGFGGSELPGTIENTRGKMFGVWICDHLKRLAKSDNSHTRIHREGERITGFDYSSVMGQVSMRARDARIQRGYIDQNR